ncbi:MAG: hypothetical protein ACXWCY_30100 [Burkholderiales bacterium]
MLPLKTISVQKLFVLAIVGKIASSGLGWWLNDPWVLGFSVPLLVMALYVALGLARDQSDVSDEKFADSCYYLGFIFTISSIIFSLFDLPQIGEKIAVIAVRFGAAMVSTVVGLIVRVYLVSFKEEPAEALRAAEESVVDAHARLREQLLITLEKMQEFQSEIDLAARASVERVNIQIENLTQSYGSKVQAFFQQLTTEKRDTDDKAYSELRTASVRISEFVKNYAESLEQALARMDERLHGYSVDMSDDEYRTGRLAAKLKHLHDSPDPERSDVYRVPTTLGSALNNLRSAARNPERRPANVIELPSSAAPRREAPAPFVQVQSAITAVCDSLVHQQQATSKLTAAVEELVKRDEQAAERLASLDQRAGDTAGRLLPIVHALSEIAKDVRAIAPAFEACQTDLRAVRDAVAAEVKRKRARLGH